MICGALRRARVQSYFLKKRNGNEVITAEQIRSQCEWVSGGLWHVADIKSAARCWVVKSALTGMYHIINLVFGICVCTTTRIPT